MSAGDIRSLQTMPATLEPRCLGERLLQIVDRPLLLLALLLAANAVARPYANIDHDARLYSVQVLNHAENGAYQDDLFFRYGSQDQFSLFSLLLAPVVKVIGLEWTFFLVYLAGTILFIAALSRLVRRLVEDRLLALLALLYLVIAPLQYGGLSTFHVHEQFLTPRLLAEGLVLLGLDQLLQARYLPSLLLMVGAGLLHPLMAVGGFLTWGGVLLVEKLGWRRAALIAGCLTLAGAVVLAIPPVARRLLGSMDDTWRDSIRCASAFNFPSEWEAGDWLNVLACGLALGAGVCLYHRSDPRRASFYALVLLLGIAAVLGTVLAAALPYALPLQGQPYRALWILKVLEVPLCFVLANRLWRLGTILPRILAVALVGYFTMDTPLLIEWWLPVLLLLPTITYFRGLDEAPRRPHWLLRSLLASLVIGQLIWGTYTEVVCLMHWDLLLVQRDTFEVIRLLLLSFGAVPWMVLVLGLVVCLARIGGGRRAVGLVCLGLFLFVQLFFFLVPSSSYARQHETGELADILYARSFLEGRHGQGGGHLTIYSAYSKLDYVWLGLKANSYFDWWQTGGFIFERQMTLEGQRRALLVGPFEVEHFREIKAFLPPRIKRQIQHLFQRGFEQSAPTVEQLAQLCQEDVDYVLIKQEFPGLYSASNGRVFIYDCRYVRAALKQSLPRTAIAQVRKGTDPGQPSQASFRSVER